MNPAHAAEQFDVAGRLVTINPYGAGNVNDTFLAVFRTTFSEERIVVQRINKRVFSRPEWIMENMRALADHVHRKLEQEADNADRIWQLPRVIPCKDGQDYYIDDEQEYWRAITLIASSSTYEKPVNAEHVFEVGTVLGQFHRLISDLPPDKLHDTLPGFHKTPLYVEKYDKTLECKKAQELLKHSMEANRLRRFVEERRDFAGVLENALASGELRTRLVHGDPKVANVMIDNLTGKGTSIIDLDTVKPGLIHCDFGDALRSACNPVGEETTSLKEVFFDIDLFDALVRGYMMHAKRFLTDADRHYLYDAIRLLAFELGLRFFQDYLAGNNYFKVYYKEHNLNRARVQFRLCESIETRERVIRQALKKYEV